jgi:hypothetical protein
MTVRSQAMCSFQLSRMLVQRCPHCAVVQQCSVVLALVSATTAVECTEVWKRRPVATRWRDCSVGIRG